VGTALIPSCSALKPPRHNQDFNKHKKTKSFVGFKL